MSSTLEADPVRLRVTYTLTNARADEVFVLEGTPTRNGQQQVSITTSDVTVHLSGGEAELLVGIAPLPPYPVTYRVIPFATRLLPQASLTRSFELPLPLREHNPYGYRGYLTGTDASAPEDAPVDRLSLVVHTLSSRAAGFAAEPLDLDPRFQRVSSSQTVHDVESSRATWSNVRSLLMRSSSAGDRHGDAASR